MISFEQQNNETYVVIKFGVTAHGLKGRLATLTLVPPGYPQPVYLPGPALSQSLILAEGLQAKQFLLPLSAFPQVLGPPPKLFHVAATCDQFVAFSDEFAFQPTSDACDCGHNLKEKFLTVAVTAGTGPLGPAYYGSERYKPRYYRGWPRLMDASVPAATRVTANEREIIEVMAASEGPMDAVQSYDSEILSIGAMQKTIRLSQGTGELNKQLFEFKSQSSSQFDCLIGKCGWDVTDEGNNKYRVTYTEAGHTPYGEQALMDKVRSKNNTVGGKSTKNPVIDCFIRLGRDETFQDKQIYDYVVRLRNVLQIFPVNSHVTPYPYTTGQYLRSNVGRAIALDENVNRPTHTPYFLGAALEQLLATRPGLAGTDPATWMADDEQALIKLYAVYRVSKKFSASGTRPILSGMVHGPERLNSILDGFAHQQPPVDVKWLPRQVVKAGKKKGNKKKK